MSDPTSGLDAAAELDAVEAIDLVEAEAAEAGSSRLEAPAGAPALTPKGPGRDIAVYGAGLIVGQLISAVTTPLFTRHLGPTAFGSLELLTVITSLLATVVLAGSDLAAIRLYYEAPTEDERTSVLSTGLAAVLMLGIGALILVTAASEPLARLVFPHDSGGRTVIVTGGLWVVASVVATYTIEILRVLRRPWAFLISGLLRSALGGIISVVLVLTLTNGVEGIYLGLLAGAVAAGLFNIGAGRRVLAFRFRGAVARRMLAYGLPLVSTGLAGWSMMLVDRLVLAHDRPLAEVGYYAVANRIAALLLLAVYGFRAGWAAYAVELHHADAEAERVVRAETLGHLMAGVCLFAVALGAPARELVQIVAGNAYLAAAKAVPVLVLALVFFAAVPVIQTALQLHHRTRDMAIHSFVAAVVNLVACLALIPTFGLMGAAAGTLIGFAWQTVAYYRRAQSVDSAPYPLGRLAALGALMIPFLALGPVAIGGFWTSLAVKALAVLLFGGLLLASGLVDRASLLALAGRRAPIEPTATGSRQQ